MRDRSVVFLTGATGAIGPAIAAELLASDVAERLLVLIRPGAAGLGQRFDEFLAALDHELSERPHGRFNWRRCVTPIAGDLCLPQLGLDRLDRATLRQQATVIVHAAADTNFTAPLQEQTEINVGGVRRVLDLARTARRVEKTLLLSTICTSGKTEGRIYERPMTAPPPFINTYEQTKWQAEQLALASDVPLGIARVGIVLGSAASGTVHRPGAFHHLLRWIARGLVPAIPGCDHSRLDAISTERVGRFVAGALAADWPDKSIWHLAAGDAAAYVEEFCQIIYSVLFPGEPVQNMQTPGEPFMVAPARFDALRHGMTDRRDRLSRSALDAMSTFVPMLPLARVFDTARAARILTHDDDWREALLRVLHRMEPRVRRAVA